MMSFRLRLVVFALAAVILASTGCDSGGEDSPAKVAGSWNLTQSFSTGAVVKFTVTFVQEESTLTGTSAYGPVSGSVSGDSILFTIRDEDLKRFKGVVNGASMAGTFNEDFENTNFRMGTWTATKIAT